ncbi:MAG: LacI family DNA-binding transcriptional regulator [Microbacterium gubbeenense]|uniref:LacI family DNA-binding transcriptional regulator n=1 Tax=Microbacterium gubbeenense TaxID=159896 RepID=UPI003F9D05A5
MATYKDIQRATGLSLSTISKHFNGAPVRPENATAIKQAADELCFRVNGVARGLRSGRSETVGVLVPSLDNGFILALIAGVERHLRRHGIGVLVSSSPALDDAPGEAVESLRSRMVDGIVSVPSPHDVAALGSARRAGLPIVTIDHTFADLEADHVQLDNRAAGAMAAFHLLDHGHRRIGVIGGGDAIGSLGERRDGFVEALESRGLGGRDLLLRDDEPTVDAGRRAMHAMIARDDRPSAVFTANYDLSIGGLIALNESGLSVPDELSFVGFDLDDIARVSRPRATTIAQPIDVIAEKAAGLMLERIGRGPGGDPRFVTVPADLTAGESVRRHR